MALNPQRMQRNKLPSNAPTEDLSNLVETLRHLQISTLWLNLVLIALAIAIVWAAFAFKNA
jgi:hypothetical protein